MSNLPHPRRYQVFLSFCVAAVVFGMRTTGAGYANELSARQQVKAKRPNILFAIADDWGWPHAGAYGDPVVKTPAFDRLAREGILFEHAYVSSPSCTPSRGAILTGQYHWRLGAAANLWSVFPDRLTTYPEILEKAGYQTGHSSKAWGPGRTETKQRLLAGKAYRDFAAFWEMRDGEKPFCYWLGSSDPHRPYALNSGEKSGMDLAKIKLPACFPDNVTTRGDVADYYLEVQRFDQLVQDALKILDSAGELDNTIVVMTGDHGMPFPRGKSNLYDTGVRVPLAIRWPQGIARPRPTAAFTSLTDLAPTFLEAAGIEVPAEMTGKTLRPLLASAAATDDAVGRDYVVFGKERHVPSQEAPDSGGYPCRAMRNYDFLYIRNFAPDRWPNGTPNYEQAFLPGTWYGDTDNGPTKTFIIENKDKDEAHRRLYDLSFGKRPAEELYDLRVDPDQLNNVAGEEQYQSQLKSLAEQLTKILTETGDPRVVGKGQMFDEFPYLGGGPKHPSWKK